MTATSVGLRPVRSLRQIEVRSAEIGGDLWEVDDALLERAKSKRARRRSGCHRRSREAAHQEPTIVGKAVGKELRQGLIGPGSSGKGCQSDTSSKAEKDREHHSRAPFGPELDATSAAKPVATFGYLSTTFELSTPLTRRGLTESQSWHLVSGGSAGPPHVKSRWLSSTPVVTRMLTILLTAGETQVLPGHAGGLPGQVKARAS